MAVKVSEIIEDALWVAKVVAYAEGMSMIAKSNTEYGWGINLANVISLWRGGCIIRASLLKDLKKAFEINPNLESLIASEHLAEGIQKRISKLRELVSTGVDNGVPTMALSSALNYLDFMSQKRASTVMIQGLRDFFGAHTYARNDRAGTFHTLWSADRSEVKLKD